MDHLDFMESETVASKTLSRDYTPYFWGAGAVLSFTLATVGLHAMFESGNFNDDGYWPNSGVTQSESFGFIEQLFLFPLGFVCLCTFVLSTYKSKNKGDLEKTIALGAAVLAGTVAAIVAYSRWRGGQLLACGFFCSDAAIPEDDDNPTVYLYGVLALMVGLAYEIIFAFPLFRSLTRTLAVAEAGSFAAEESTSLLRGLDDGMPRLSGSATVPTTWCWPGSDLAVFLVFVFLFPFLMFASSVLPSSFEYFYRSEIQAYEADCWHVSTYGTYLGDAVRIEVKGWCLTFWPDILGYYFFLYLVLALALLSRTSRLLRAVLHSRVGYLGGCTLGELGMVALLLMLYAFEFIYWMYWRGVFNSVRNHENNLWERSARTAGQLLNLTMGLLVLPVARNNAFSSLLGVSWEAIMVWHQYLGDVFLVGVAWHVISFLGVFHYDGLGVASSTLWNTEYDADNWTITVQVWVTMIFVVTHGVLTLNWIRRKYFEVFYYAHHTFLALFMSSLFHANSCWYYVVGGLALWFVDRLMRTSSAYASVAVQVFAGSEAGVTQLSYAVDSVFPWSKGAEPLACKPGQFCFINVPEVSTLEWHPFTISSAPEDEATTHHIKAMGEGTFTAKLHDLAKTISEPLSLVVNVEGPFGTGVQLAGYEHVVLVAGGIGVTPCHAVFRHLLLAQRHGTWPAGLQSVELVWVARSTGLLETFSDTFVQAQGVSELKMSFFVTGSTEKPTALPFRTGRPDIASIIEPVRSAGMGTLLFHCGPQALADRCKAVAIETSIDFHTETFEL